MTASVTVLYEADAVPAVAVTVTGPVGGAGSFSKIVRTAVLGLPSVAPTGLESVRLTVSSPSKVVSEQVATKNDLLVSPALNVNVPEAEM